MTSQLFRRTVSGVLALISASLAMGQYGVDVVVPRTTARVKGENARKVHTNHLIYVGAWRQKRSEPPNEAIPPHGPAVRQATVDGYHPADIRRAYNIPDNGGNQAIAIVDAFHLPTALNDFNVFSNQFGLPTEPSSNPTSSSNQVLQVVYAAGTRPATNADWGGEIALDIEWAHAIAPRAKIYLIECASDSLDDLLAGVRVAAQIPDVRQISMSFGANEFTSERTFDNNFVASNRVFLAAAGDASNQVSYPAVSPNVVSVGGTHLTFSNGVANETAWTSSGGGVSTVEPRPSYQDIVANIVGSFRGTPDISAVADPQTGVAVYDSTPMANVGSGWLVFGGTSLATPVCAGIINVRGFYPASSVTELAREYGLLGTTSLRDVVSGVSGRHAAARGYDLVTGVGSPLGVFADVAASATSVTAVTGTPVSGVPSNVAVKDGHSYIVRSVTASSGNQQVVIGGAFSPTLPSGSVVYGGSISVTGSSTGSTNRLSLLNVSTGQYENVGTLALGTTLTTVKVTVANPANYVDSTGRMRFRITGTSSTSFRLAIDQIRLTATPM